MKVTKKKKMLVGVNVAAAPIKLYFLFLAPVAQLDRALDFESRGQGFESSRARHTSIETINLKTN